MGKSLSKAVKVKAKIILDSYEEHLSIDFEKNKIFVKSLEFPFSKNTRNLIAGYIARQIKANSG